MAGRIDRPLFSGHINQVLLRYSIQIFSTEIFTSCLPSRNPIHPTSLAAEFEVYIQISLLVPGVQRAHTNTFNNRSR